MPRNEGIEPPFASVDIRYRSGMVVRGIDPSTRRWTLKDADFGGEAGSDFDIVDWQPVGAGRPSGSIM